MQLKNYHKILANVPDETSREVELSMQTLDRIHELLEEKFNGRQKELAEALLVSEAAVSKMINGIQNFNFSTIIKLEKVFNTPILAILSSPHIKMDNLEFRAVKSVPIICQNIFVTIDGNLVDELFTKAESQ